MKCRHCGYEIDTRYKFQDGSVQCENCGAIYRPRPNNQQSTRQNSQGQSSQRVRPYRQTSRSRQRSTAFRRPQRSKAFRRFSRGKNVGHLLQSVLATRIGNRPLWAIVTSLAVIIALLVTLISVVGGGKKVHTQISIKLFLASKGHITSGICTESWIALIQPWSIP